MSMKLTIDKNCAHYVQDVSNTNTNIPDDMVINNNMVLTYIMVSADDHH